MWARDEFIARERVAERNRDVLEAARVRGLIGADDRPPVRLAPDPASSRRAVARVLAATGRIAVEFARRLDPAVEIDPGRGVASAAGTPPVHHRG